MTKNGRNCRTRWKSRSSPIAGEIEARTATARASATGRRTAFHSGVVSRQMNSAPRNQVRYQGSSRLTGCAGSSSAQRLKSE
jgi:hypothetical protein